MAAHGKADTERDARRAELQQNDLRREATRKNLETLLGIRTQGKIGYSGTRTQINVVLTITLNTLGSVFLTDTDDVAGRGHDLSRREEDRVLKKESELTC